jgi:hydroxymethylpyrimidine kinase/phosphomethylpyrimidine kinase
MSAPVVCSIGATDPWNAAGLGLDIRALAELGARPVTVVAAVTAQDRRGLAAVAAVAPDLVRAQLAALADAEIAAYRIGALVDAATVGVVAAHVRDAGVPVVYDPVLAASGGGSFVDGATLAALADVLLPAVTLVTPNLDESVAFVGGPPIGGVEAMERAAFELVMRGARAALVKGGHLRGEPVDVLADAEGFARFEGPRLAGSLRGTGCLLACALAASLARNVPLRDAVARAREFVRARIAHGIHVAGMRLAY